MIRQLKQKRCNNSQIDIYLPKVKDIHVGIHRAQGNSLPWKSGQGLNSRPLKPTLLAISSLRANYSANYAKHKSCFR